MKIHVRDMGTSEIVRSIEIEPPVTDRQVERVIMGLLRNMDRDRFYADDSEVVTVEMAEME